MVRRVLTMACLVAALGPRALIGAELSVANLAMTPGSTGAVVVSGTVSAESTFGVEILVELVPRAGAIGTVTFTSAPPTDITQVGDPWPTFGTFNGLDTDLSGSPLLNGSVDDSGSNADFVTFSGPLTSFPVVADGTANGVWDVVLATSVADSRWTGLTNVLIAGTITVGPAGCSIDADCDDGSFCNGLEACVSLVCVGGSASCPGQLCDEVSDVCVNCLGASDCDDGLFCNGVETCDVSFLCQPGTNPCGGQACLEASDTCVGVICSPPVVETIGPRYFEVTPGVGPAEVALRVTGAEPAVACVTGWVRADGVVGLSAESRPPAGVGGWNTISVRGAELVSGRAYSVRTDCDPANPGNLLSEPTTVTLWPFADVDNFNGVSIIDVTRILDGFSAVFNGSQACGSDANCAAVFPNFTCDTSANRCVRIRRENVDITAPAGCLPDGAIDILDVTTALDAFRGTSDPCRIPCP